ncbi:MAG TPA: hypothetical protein VJ483_07290, partial [Holophagaceae bacterium]|nr:hypothetical protein [Holophagaceae bacterium]
ILAVMNAGYLIIASWAFYSLWSARRDLKAVNEHALHEEPSLGWVAPFGTFVTESIEETSPRDAWHFREQSWFWATDWRLRKLQDGWALIDKDGGRVRLAAECAESEVLSELTCGMKLDISIQGERHKLEVVKVPERPR